MAIICAGIVGSKLLLYDELWCGLLILFEYGVWEEEHFFYDRNRIGY